MNPRRPPVLVFDIETVADCDGFRRLRRLPEDLSQTDVLALMQSERLSESGTTFWRHHLHRVVSVSLLLAEDDKLRLWTLGRDGEDEGQILQRFFSGLEKINPTLVSWNGSGFDLPVMHYRALMHGVNAARYFEVGDRIEEYRYNHYLNRFHWRHIDMMDVLAGYQLGTRAPLDEIAKLCGLPGKLETDGAQVQALWQAGKAETICDYCETDVLNTYGVYLQFERLRGRLSADALREKQMQLRAFLQRLQNKGQTHIGEFLAVWSGTY